nr:MAG TPA: hypothetical protein [Caudoviricetes sp.]DAX91161.1 MAG TPA: hypothetical protein [Caudoviricetes sp.]
MTEVVLLSPTFWVMNKFIERIMYFEDFLQSNKIAFSI